jgi:hypothetical protein
MNIFVKLGLSALAGAAVLFGINCVEKHNEKKNEKANVEPENKSSTLESEGVTVTSSPNEEIQKENNPNKNKFMESAKKTQVTIEVVSKIVTCMYRIVVCINDIFSTNNRHYYGSCYNNGCYQGTIII